MMFIIIFCYTNLKQSYILKKVTSKLYEYDLNLTDIKAYLTIVWSLVTGSHDREI